MNSNLILTFYVVPLLFGILFLTPLRTSISSQLVKKFPSLENQTHQTLFGLTLIILSGFAVSAQTLWISNKISEGGNFCSSANVFDCDSVIGNAQYNSVPFLDNIPWGLVGMIAFAILLYFVRTVANDPQAEFVERHIKYGKTMTLMGLGVILLLIYYEIKMGKICQYCTTAHVANIAAMFGFIELEKVYATDEWKKLK